MGVGAAVLVAYFLWRSSQWQRSSRVLLGMRPDVSWYAPLILVIALAAAAGLVLIGRAVRLGVRTVGRFLARFVPAPVAIVVAVAVVGVVVGGTVEGFLLRGLLAVARHGAALTDKDTPEDVDRPTTPLSSGGPGSLVDWDSLGYQGRAFTGRTTPTAELTRFAGRPAADPIRAYVGLRSAPTPRERAALAVRELDRAGAFARPVIAVMGTTGTGWIDRAVPASLEYLYAGDVASVAAQYSYLPSWISFLSDRSEAATTGRELVGAVRRHIDALPARAARPRLLVFGESLGAYGVSGAFDTPAELTEDADGVLQLGPPNATPLWRHIVANRDRGSPMWHPVYERGRRVRFAQRPAELAEPGPEWAEPRAVYLQNANDPVVWWNTDLLTESPGWLHGPRSPYVSKDMHWYPVITFWQVVFDLVFSLDAPLGQGHNYGVNVVDGWVAVHRPSGWTDADTERLRGLLAVRDEPAPD